MIITSTQEFLVNPSGVWGFPPTIRLLPTTANKKDLVVHFFIPEKYAYWLGTEKGVFQKKENIGIWVISGDLMTFFVEVVSDFCNDWNGEIKSLD